MPRQDVAFLKDQLDEQTSACWKQRKWSIVAENNNNNILGTSHIIRKVLQCEA